MRETAFTPPPPAERHGVRAMLVTGARRGFVGRQPVPLIVLGVAAIFGAASEGFDRLTAPHFLRDIACLRSGTWSRLSGSA
jgi:hypothetical protein